MKRFLFAALAAIALAVPAQAGVVINITGTVDPVYSGQDRVIQARGPVQPTSVQYAWFQPSP